MQQILLNAIYNIILNTKINLLFCNITRWPILLFLAPDIIFTSIGFAWCAKICIDGPVCSKKNY